MGDKLEISFWRENKQRSVIPLLSWSRDEQHRAGALSELQQVVQATAQEVGGKNRPASAVDLRNSDSGKTTKAVAANEAEELAKEKGERERAATGCKYGVGRW